MLGTRAIPMWRTPVGASRPSPKSAGRGNEKPRHPVPCAGPRQLCASDRTRGGPTSFGRPPAAGHARLPPLHEPGGGEPVWRRDAPPQLGGGVLTGEAGHGVRVPPERKKRE